MNIRVIVNGAAGKMGQVSCDAVAAAVDLDLVAATTRQHDLAAIIREKQADVVVDFTLPSCALANAQVIIQQGACPVIGTSGLELEHIQQLQALCASRSLGGLVAPNFSMAAVLMMKYAQDAARYLPDVEILELHHPQKVDAPSGTAKKTAQMIAAVQKNKEVADYQDIPIHSMRLSGCFAHQAVVFGNTGETLTIRHDAMNRSSMMSGLLIACRQVVTLDSLVYGLENILFANSAVEII